MVLTSPEQSPGCSLSIYTMSVSGDPVPGGAAHLLCVQQLAVGSHGGRLVGTGLPGLLVRQSVLAQGRAQVEHANRAVCKERKDQPCLKGFCAVGPSQLCPTNTPGFWELQLEQMESSG